MIKKIFLILFAIVSVFSTNSIAQDLQEWYWNSRQIAFVAMDDMEIVLNESEEFEAHNDNISMYYKVMDFGDKSKKDMIDFLWEIADDSGLNHNAEHYFISNENMDGMYILGEDDDRPYLLFSLGNKPQNSIVIGIISYEASWQNTVIEMVRSIYLDI